MNAITESSVTRGFRLRGATAASLAERDPDASSVQQGRKPRNSCAGCVPDSNSRFAPPPAQPRKSVDDWVIEIKGFFTRASTDTLDLARTVHTARTQLSHGQWSGLCRSRRLPFDKRTGERLVAIWEGLRELNASTLSRFPNGRTVLYLLSRLSPSLLVQLVQEGAILPALSVGEAKELFANYGGSGIGPQFNVRRRVGKFRDFVRSTHCQWNCQEAEFAITVLAELVDELERHSLADAVTQETFAPLFVNSPTVLSFVP